MMAPVVVSHGSRLVGRDAELQQLASWLGLEGSASDPSPATGPDAPPAAVLLAGDAGVGKTRLTRALGERAVSEGWRVDAGHCLDFADSALPYLPFSEILGRLERDLPDVVAEVVAAHPALARLQPGRRMRSTGSDDSTDLGRGDLLPAVHALLEAVAAERPYLVVVEDAHWADQSTRDLLSFLFTRATTGRIALLVSYRSDDLHRRHPLRRQLTTWARDAHRLPLEPLPPRDLRRLVRSLVRNLAGSGPRVSEAEIAAIVDRADGNAFFAEELVVAATGEGGAALPDDLADLLLVRLDLLDDDATQVVRAASVSGRRVSHALLAAASSLSADRLEQAVRHAVEMNVLEPRSDEAYVFRHALLAEAVYDDLLPGERVRLHGAYASAILDHRAPGSAAELARHARLGNDPATALRACVEAGGDAMRVGAPEEAAQHYQHAVELLGAPGTEDFDAEALADLVRRAADALIAAGHIERAIALVRDQLDQLPADATDAVRGQMITALATAIGMSDTAEDLVGMTREAVRLTATAPVVARVRALSFNARALVGYGDRDEARQVALEAYGLAEKHDLPRLASDALATLVGLDRHGPVEEVARSLEDVVARARKARAVNAELRALYFLGILHLERAEHDEAADAFARGVRRGAAAGTPWAPYAFDCRFQLARVAMERGDWGGVDDLTDMAGQSPPPLNEALLLTLRARLAAARGESDAQRIARSVRPWWSADGLVAIGGATAELTLAEHARDTAAALGVYDDVVRAATLTWREFFQARLRLAAITLGVLATAAQGDAGAGLGEEERAALSPRAAGLRRDGQRVLADVREADVPFGPEGLAWEARLEAEWLRWRWVTDVDPPAAAELAAAWRLAEERTEAAHDRTLLAQVRARLAGVLHATGDAEGAKEAALAARRTADVLGLAPLLTTLGAGSRPSAAGAPTGRTRAPAAALTSREREILGLVAQGRTNGEIARRLYISVKTVSVHVSNILGKLGASGRTEAAAIAHRDGLL